MSVLLPSVTPVIRQFFTDLTVDDRVNFGGHELIFLNRNRVPRIEDMTRDSNGMGLMTLRNRLPRIRKEEEALRGT